LNIKIIDQIINVKNVKSLNIYKINVTDYYIMSEIIRSEIINVNYLHAKIDNKIYLYKMLTMNLLQAMLVRRAEQSH